MNANPSGSRTPSTGCRGESEARRAAATTTGPSRGLAQLDVRAGMSGRVRRRGKWSSGGSRHAKRVCRGALNPRRTAQGRVGDEVNPRHVESHRVPHRLLSAQTSAPAGAVRPRLRIGARPRLAKVAPARDAASRPKAKPGKCRAPRLGSCDTELLQSGPDVTLTSACAQFRRKGVLAA